MSDQPHVPKPSDASTRQTLESASETPTRPSVPKTDGFGTGATSKIGSRKTGTRSLPSPACTKLRKLVRQLEVSIDKEADLSRANAQDRKGFRATLIGIIIETFPLKRGRPPDPLIDEACKLLREGKSVPGILREQIKDWATLDKYTRYLAAKGLRQAAARRHKKSGNQRKRHRKGTSLKPPTK